LQWRVVGAQESPVTHGEVSCGEARERHGEARDRHGEVSCGEAWGSELWGGEGEAWGSELWGEGGGHTQAAAHRHTHPHTDTDGTVRCADCQTMN
jgi:hypothetical protein